jgi:uncharacterized protein YjbI with pentapeptide repeats
MPFEPDRTPPSPQRQAVLEAAYEANLAAGQPPYEDVHVCTRGELEWVLAQRKWTGTYIGYFEAFEYFSQHGALDEASVRTLPAGYAGYQRPDLRGVNLREGNFGDVELVGADMRGAKLDFATMHNMSLHGVDLRGASLHGVGMSQDSYKPGLAGANLSGTYLEDANLTGAKLVLADLSEARVGGTNFRGASFTLANLKGADFNSAVFSPESSLQAIQCDERTRFQGVAWIGVSLD